MLLLDLYDALRPLDLITGATYADDVLDIIFKTFAWESRMWHEHPTRLIMAKTAMK